MVGDRQKMPVVAEMVPERSLEFPWTSFLHFGRKPVCAGPGLLLKPMVSWAGWILLRSGASHSCDAILILNS